MLWGRGPLSWKVKIEDEGDGRCRGRKRKEGRRAFKYLFVDC